MRIYSLLASLAVTAGTKMDKGRLPTGLKPTHQSITNTLGMNRLTVTKAMKELSALNAVAKRSGIYYVQESALINSYLK